MAAASYSAEASKSDWHLQSRKKVHRPQSAFEKGFKSFTDVSEADLNADFSRKNKIDRARDLPKPLPPAESDRTGKKMVAQPQPQNRPIGLKCVAQTPGQAEQIDAFWVPDKGRRKVDWHPRTTRGPHVWPLQQAKQKQFPQQKWRQLYNCWDANTLDHKELKTWGDENGAGHVFNLTDPAEKMGVAVPYNGGRRLNPQRRRKEHPVAWPAWTGYPPSHDNQGRHIDYMLSAHGGSLRNMPMAGHPRDKNSYLAIEVMQHKEHLAQQKQLAQQKELPQQNRPSRPASATVLRTTPTATFGGSQPSGSQPSGSQPSGSQPSGSQPSGSQPRTLRPASATVLRTPPNQPSVPPQPTSVPQDANPPPSNVQPIRSIRPASRPMSAK